jgi:hypothetical protein
MELETEHAGMGAVPGKGRRISLMVWPNIERTTRS